MSHPVHLRLDSSIPGQTGWTCISSPPTLLLRCDNPAQITTLHDSGGLLRQWDRPLDALRWLEKHARQQGPLTKGRWIGYLSYDLGRLFEDFTAPPPDDLNLPLFMFAFVDDSASESLPNPARTNEQPAAGWSQAIPGPRDSSALRSEGGSSLLSTFSRDSYLAAVSKVIDYIRAGDVFQVNLSQRFTVPLPAPPTSIYQRLLESAPAKYGALLDFGDHALICNSPELFLRVVHDRITGKRRVLTRPIKGTRPRSPGKDRELRDSVKDQAELNMIVDLERNDLGRVCEIGTVRVLDPRVIEAHPTLYHGAACVEGVLREDVGFVDLLRATFPGGSVTGAPKIRAMEIIDELEPVARGPYCGAIGYLASDGTIEFNIAIRTMIIRGGLVHIPVGGGIVADSNPAQEYEETLVKARAIFHALDLA